MSNCPFHHLVSPLTAVRRLNLDIVICKALHHAILGGLLEEHLTCGTIVLCCEVLHLLIREVPKAFVALVSDMHRHYRLHIGSQRVGPFGVGKNVEIGNRQLMQEVECVVEVLICLAGKTNNDISSYAAMWHYSLYLINAILIEIALVAPSHSAKYLIATTL